MRLSFSLVFTLTVSPLYRNSHPWDWTLTDEECKVILCLELLLFFKLNWKLSSVFTCGLSNFGELSGKSICYVKIFYLGTKICSKITDLSSVETVHIRSQLNRYTAWQQWLLLPFLSRIEVTRMNVWPRITYILGFLFHTCGSISPAHIGQVIVDPFVWGKHLLGHIYKMFLWKKRARFLLLATYAKCLLTLLVTWFKLSYEFSSVLKCIVLIFSFNKTSI